MIGIAGNGPGCGKDTTGEILARYGYKRKAFADGVKEEAQSAISLIGSGPKFLLQDLDEAFLSGDRDSFKKPTSPLMRRILQLWGTEYRRAQDEDYWVKRANPSAGDVFTDVRFQNEIEAIRSAGGIMLWVMNPRIDTSETHASENDVFEGDCDLTLVNDGTLEQLRETVDGAMAILGDRSEREQVLSALAADAQTSSMGYEDAA